MIPPDLQGEKLTNMLIYALLSARIQKNSAQIAQYLIDGTLFLSACTQTGHSTEQYSNSYRGRLLRISPKKGLTTAGRDAIIVRVQGRLAQLVRAPR